jgi:hypothetical protein
MAQVVEHLLSKHGAQIPVITKRKKKGNLVVVFQTEERARAQSGKFKEQK